jgi:membrane-bound ClpP family serine protease
LYLIAGGYLLALGLMFLVFKFPGAVAALPIVAGALIFIFPELIPFTFAGFLGLFGLIMLFSFQLSFLGILTLIIAILIIMNPDSVAYFIAFFMLVYSVSNLIQFYKQWKNRGPKETSDGEIIIE